MAVARAYVMVKTEVGMAEKVQDELLRVPGISAADIVTGDFDLVLVIEGPSNEDIGRLVMRDIHGISGVGPTITFIVIG
jgi:DNA-binding Lrp family transcriptional regulator